MGFLWVGWLGNFPDSEGGGTFRILQLEKDRYDSRLKYHENESMISKSTVATSKQVSKHYTCIFLHMHASIQRTSCSMNVGRSN